MEAFFHWQSSAYTGGLVGIDTLVRDVDFSHPVQCSYVELIFKCGPGQNDDVQWQELQIVLGPAAISHKDLVLCLLYLNLFTQS